MSTLEGSLAGSTENVVETACTMPLPITDLVVDCFRGLRGVSLTDFARVNILVGPNNSGKTSVLEILSLAANPLDPERWMRVATRRDPLGFALRAGFKRLRWLFPQDSNNDLASSYDGRLAFSVKGELPVHELRATYRDVRSLAGGSPAQVFSASDGAPPNVTASGDALPALADFGAERNGATIEIDITEGSAGGAARRESFTWWEDERFELPRVAPVASVPIQVITPHDHLFPGAAASYSEARRSGNADGISTILSLVDPRITGIEVLAAPGTSRQRPEATIYLRDRSAGLLPLEAFGDGIRRVLLIATAIASARNGILLIDELETAIHISALGNAFHWIVEACEANNVQLFATTHSLEAIDSLLAADDTPENEDIVGYRLETTHQTVTVRRYGEDLLRRLRIERGVEVR
ncbi:MAG: AAA family ATPase [Myxococcales bacterium]|nr:AAA family ATPase [Myxococcales bacterium]